MNNWSIAVEDRNSVDVAYIDCAKAFDIVNNKLFCKLGAMGETGNLLMCIKTLFLRKQ